MPGGNGRVPGVEGRAGKFPGPSLMPALTAIQREHGWLPRESLVVLARDIHAEAAGRREHAATTHRRAAETAQREDTAAAQHDSQAAAQWEGTAAAERHQARTAAIIERRYLPSFDEADLLRLGIATPAGAALWLDAYESSSSKTEDHYRLETAHWLTPLPVDGLLTLVCAWPEIGLPETRTDIILPELAVRAAQTFPLWAFAEDAET